ncbi:unnamed protein product [Pleuronectes platessa]|uniref:Uncharacterized protein n=1 Tax=Pleuronectes platessa TaxID=8262 RepID=A0A9N7V3M1_PLEPL|nr:unnamed protein product [Pleuronectes platessa]
MCLRGYKAENDMLHTHGIKEHVLQAGDELQHDMKEGGVCVALKIPQQKKDKGVILGKGFRHRVEIARPLCLKVCGVLGRPLWQQLERRSRKGEGCGSKMGQ